MKTKEQRDAHSALEKEVVILRMCASLVFWTRRIAVLYNDARSRFYSSKKILLPMSVVSQPMPCSRPSPVMALHLTISQCLVWILSSSRICNVGW